MDNISLGYVEALSDIFNKEKIILLILCIAILVGLSKSIKIISERLCHKFSARRILISQTTTIVNFILHLGGSFYIFYAVLKPPKELMIALLGSATFAVGLALKDLVASLISGITLIMDPPFQVGDRVKFKDIYGEIKQVGLRAVRLQSLDSKIITIPNLNFVNEAVICANKGKLNLNVSTRFYVNVSADIALIKRTLREVAITSKYIYLEEPINIIVDTLWSSDCLSFEITVNAHAIDARFEKAFQTDMYTRGAQILTGHGIPFPRQPEVARESNINFVQQNEVEFERQIRLTA